MTLFELNTSNHVVLDLCSDTFCYLQMVLNF